MTFSHSTACPWQVPVFVDEGKAERVNLYESSESLLCERLSLIAMHRGKLLSALVPVTASSKLLFVQKCHTALDLNTILHPEAQGSQPNSWCQVLKLSQCKIGDFVVTFQPSLNDLLVQTFRLSSGQYRMLVFVIEKNKSQVCFPRAWSPGWWNSSGIPQRKACIRPQLNPELMREQGLLDPSRRFPRDETLILMVGELPYRPKHRE